MITLETLIRVAEFDAQTRELLLKKLNAKELDVDQEESLKKLCWEMILTLFETELEVKMEEMLNDTIEGKKYEQNDYTEERLKLVYSYARKFDEAQSPQVLEEVKKNLIVEKKLPDWKIPNLNGRV